MTDPPVVLASRSSSALDEYHVLDSVAEPEFDELVRMVARRFRCEHAELSIVAPNRVWLKAATVDSGLSRPPDQALCTDVAKDGAAIVLPDAALSLRFAHHPRVNGFDSLRFYAGVPLITADGTVIGALCAWDEQPRSVSDADLEFLEFCGRAAMTLLDLRRRKLQSDNDDAVLAAIGTLLELIVNGAPTGTVLDRLARAVEAQMPATRCSILLLDGSILHHGAAPSLPQEFRDAIDGVRIGPSVGSCGTAAYRRETVIVSDIATDLLWADYRTVALRADLLACWSVPIIHADGRVLGTFALYYGSPRTPAPDDLQQIGRWVNVAELAICRALDVAALREAAALDPLTGLINRVELERLLRISIGEPQSSFAVLFVDLDQFKLINDTYGHSAGDRLLREVATRLRRCAEEDDVVARFGGDEFVLACRGGGADEAQQLARRIVTALQQLFTIYGSTVSLSVSVGIALHPPQVGLHSSDLIGDADLAMYAAKRSGRNSITVFDEAVRHRASARLTLEAELGDALSRNEVSCQFQPIVHLSSNTVVSMEALMRWRSPARGLVPPNDFIPAAEDTGQIVALGGFILQDACQTLASWRAVEPGWRDVSVSVNVSPRQLRDPGFFDFVRRVLDSTGLPHSALTLEVTEVALIHDASLVRAGLSQLRRGGVRISVDDFGTGYSSLSQLKTLPVDVLKIDREFVAGIADDPTDAGIVAAVLTLGRTLGLRVIAEGIETESQRRKLLSLGCEFAQGYLWSEPVTAHNMALLRASLNNKLPESN